MASNRTYIVGIDESGHNIPAQGKQFCMAAIAVPEHVLGSAIELVNSVRSELGKPKRDPKFRKIRRSSRCRQLLIDWLNDPGHGVYIACMHAEPGWFQLAGFKQMFDIAKQFDVGPEQMLEIIGSSAPDLERQWSFDQNSTMPLFIDQLLHPLGEIANREDADLKLFLDDRHDIERFARYVQCHREYKSGNLIKSFDPSRISLVERAKGDPRALSVIADWLVGDVRRFFEQWGADVIYPPLTGDAKPPHGPALELELRASETGPRRFLEIGPFESPWRDLDPVCSGGHPLLPAYSDRLLCQRVSYGMEDGHLRTLCFTEDGRWKISTATIVGLPLELFTAANAILNPPKPD